MAVKDTETDDYPTEPFRDFQPKPEPNKRPYFARSNALLDVILKSLVVFLTSVPLIIFIIFVCVEFKRNTVIIDDFEIPKEIQEQGYTSKSFVNKLLDQINIIKRPAGTPFEQGTIRSVSFQEATNLTSTREIKVPNFIKETPRTARRSAEFFTVDSMSEIEVKIPGSVFSLKFLSRYVKEFFGYPAMHIVCEATLHGDRNCMDLTTRVIGKPAKKENNVVLTNLDQTLLEAANVNRLDKFLALSIDNPNLMDAEVRHIDLGHIG